MRLLKKRLEDRKKEKAKQSQKPLATKKKI